MCEQEDYALNVIAQVDCYKIADKRIVSFTQALDLRLQ